MDLLETVLRSQDAQSRPAHQTISVRAGDSMDAPPVIEAHR